MVPRPGAHFAAAPLQCGDRYLVGGVHLGGAATDAGAQSARAAALPREQLLPALFKAEREEPE